MSASVSEAETAQSLLMIASTSVGISRPAPLRRPTRPTTIATPSARSPRRWPSSRGRRRRNRPRGRSRARRRPRDRPAPGDRQNRPAGFVTIDAKTGYLDQLCVAPFERGSGLAVALRDEAKRRSPGLVELDVNEANARALRFYERLGFVFATRGLSALSGLPAIRLRWKAGD